MKMNIKMKYLKIVIILMLLGITVGFSFLSKKMSVLGYSKISSGNWDVHFENLEVRAGSKKAIVPAAISETKLAINFTVPFMFPTDYYEIKVDVVNSGTVDAMLADCIKIGYDEEIERFIDFNIKYIDGEGLSANDILAANQKERIMVRAELRHDAPVDEIDESGKSFNLGIEMTYVQAENPSIRNMSERKITLKDGSEWYILTNNYKEDRVRLISAYNLKKENNKYVQDKTGKGDKVLFDVGRSPANNPHCQNEDNGCNIYEIQEGVTENSKIKEEVNIYETQLLNSNVLNSEAKLDLVSLDDLESLGCSDSNRTAVGSCVGAPSWLYSSNYWTKTDKSDTWTWDVWAVLEGGALTYDIANRTGTYGLRPVIDTTFANLKELTGAKVLTTSPERTVAVWMWHGSVLNVISSNQKVKESIKMLKDNNINTIYMSLDPLKSEKYYNYIREANENNIRVYGLYGDPSFVQESSYATAINQTINYIVTFNAVHKGKAYIEGVHYDIEYGCSTSDVEEAKSCAERLGFIGFVRRAREYTNRVGIEVQYDVSLFNTHYTTFYDEDGSEKVIIDELLEKSDAIALMSYGTTPNDSLHPVLYKGYDRVQKIEITRTYLQKTIEYNRELIIGQEFIVFKNYAERLQANPGKAEQEIPEYGDDYKYTKAFIERMMRDIDSILMTKIEEEFQSRLPGGKKIGYSFHHYDYLVEVINLPE